MHYLSLWFSCAYCNSTSKLSLLGCISGNFFIEMCVCVCVCVYICTCAYRVMCVCLFVTPGPSSPGSSVHGIFLARILEWVAISFSKGSSRPRDQTRISCISCMGRQILYHWANGEVLLYWGELKFKNLFIQNISMDLLCAKHRSNDQR